MATKNMAEKVAEGEQMDLIEVGPKNAKVIIEQAKIYKAALAKRLKSLATEVAAKEQLKSLIKAAKLRPMEDGIIRFRVDGFLITVEPRDEKVTVKDEQES